MLRNILFGIVRSGSVATNATIKLPVLTFVLGHIVRIIRCGDMVGLVTNMLATFPRHESEQ